jgi:hypothetical protein
MLSCTVHIYRWCTYQWRLSGIEPSYVFCFDVPSHEASRRPWRLDNFSDFRCFASCSNCPAFTVGFIMRFHASSGCSRDLIDGRTASMVYGVWMISSTSDSSHGFNSSIWFEGVSSSLHWFAWLPCVYSRMWTSTWTSFPTSYLTSHPSLLLWYEFLCNSSSETRAISPSNL